MSAEGRERGLLMGRYKRNIVFVKKFDKMLATFCPQSNSEINVAPDNFLCKIQMSCQQTFGKHKNRELFGEVHLEASDGGTIKSDKAGI